MTNFQSTKPPWINREKLLIGLPAGLGVVLALLMAGWLVWPQWQRLQIAEQEQEQLDEQRQRLPLLRAQLLKLGRDLSEAELRRGQILRLVAGSGEIATFMSQLSEEAQRAGVQLDGYEPITELAPQDAAKTNQSANKANQANTAPPDPLLAPGLKKTSLLLVARGDGPQLLAFLRQLESLNLLVVQSNLQVKAEQKTVAKTGAVKPALRLNLSLYESARQGADPKVLPKP